MSLVLDEHREYLSDPARLSAFRQAIEELVKPGDVVVDLGAGTGILGLMACRAGARRVYAIDEGDILELARELCAANGFEDRVVFIEDLSLRVDLPEKADVVLADQIGRFGFEAGIWEYFSDARRRFLKPTGSLAPSRVDLHVVPVECPETYARIDFWTSSPAGLDFSAVRLRAANTGYPVQIQSGQLLAEPAMLGSIDCAAAPAPLRFEAAMPARRAGTLHGLGGFFAAQLAPNVAMTNSPLATKAIKRRNVFFPVDHPVPLEPGDVIRVGMHIRPIEVIVSWTVEVWRDTACKARFRQSTFHGMLISRKSLTRTQADFVPRLNPWGQARLDALSLCDGRRTLAEIEQEVYRRHAELFAGLAEAAAFVSQVATPHTQHEYTFQQPVRVPDARHL